MLCASLWAEEGTEAQRHESPSLQGEGGGLNLAWHLGVPEVASVETAVLCPPTTVQTWAHSHRLFCFLRIQKPEDSWAGLVFPAAIIAPSHHWQGDQGPGCGA